MKNIAVVVGGFSAEKAISLKVEDRIELLDKGKYNMYTVIGNEGWN